MATFNLITMPLNDCPRCKGSHQAMAFRRFTLLPFPSTHWATCPTTGEPVLASLEHVRDLPVDDGRVVIEKSGKTE